MSGTSSIKKLTYNDFKNKKILGEGSFNQVYYAEHPEFGPCVVKIVTRAFFAKPKQKKKLEEEAEHMFSIRHQNLIKGYGVVMEPNHLCLVYEYAKYGCLADILRRIPDYFTWPLKIRTAYQTASAINFLHNHTEHLIHRNLKSTNVLFDQDINVKVSDFITPKSTVWMSQATQQKEITERKKIAEGQPPARKGRSLAHIPPEIVQNINTQAVESYDMYSYGVVLWELLTNKRPFDEIRPVLIVNQTSVSGWSMDDHLSKNERPGIFLPVSADAVFPTFSHLCDMNHATTEEVYRKMSENYVHPFDAVLPNRPQCLYDIMKFALSRTERERPKFQAVCEKLKPFNAEKATAAKSDAAKCKNAYDEYKATKRERIASRQTSTDQSRTTPTTPAAPAMETVTENRFSMDNQRAFVTPADNPPMKEDRVFEEEEEESSGQIVGTSARVTRQVFYPDPHRRSPSSVPTVKRASQPSDAEEKMEVEASSETEHHSASYAEEGSDVDKAEPFVDDQPAAQPAVQIRPSQQAVYNIQAGHINLHVGDNVAPSGRGDMPPERNDPNVTIPAAGSQRIITRADKYKVVNNVGSTYWRHLARHMNLSDPQIDRIDYDYEKYGLHEKIYQVIFQWENKFRGGVSVAELVEVLKEANLHEVAMKLDQ